MTGIEAEYGELAAYLYDSAVVTLGTVIENALLERVESGEGKDYKSEPKYTLHQLLDPSFKLPRPPRQKPPPVRRSSLPSGAGVTRWRMVDPAEKEPSTNGVSMGRVP